MSLKITPPSEPIVTSNLIITLFGQPGIGKSTLAYSAPKPLLFDFDGGAQRAKGRKDTVRVHSWADVADVAQADIAPYDTIVLDTVGRALEFLAAQPDEGKSEARAHDGRAFHAGLRRAENRLRAMAPASAHSANILS
jgi:hypothetical protein